MAELTCNCPDEVPPDELIAYLDDAASPAVTAHIRGCAVCRTRAGALARTRQKLQVELRRFECPTTLDLGEYLLDLLPAEERRRIAEHLGDCPRCKAEIDARRSFLLDDDDLFPGPSRHPLTLIATLFEPRRRLALAGLRGDGDTSRIYRAGDVTITVTPGADSRPGAMSLVGLVERADDESVVAGEVQLVTRAGTSRVSPISDAGYFFFENVHAGTYEVRVDLTDTVIVVPELPFSMTD